MILQKNPLAVAPMQFATGAVAGLAAHEQDLLDTLVHQWALKRPRNTLRQLYVDSKNLVDMLGISLPDDIALELGIVSGWPEKAVYALAHMCMWDGVTASGGEEDPFELLELLDQNRFDVEIGQTIAAELTHSCAFISTTPGDVASGEPPVVIMPYSAEWASGLWDRRTRALRAALVINDVDDLGRPTALQLLTPFEVINLEDRGRGWFVDGVVPHGLSRVPVETMAFRPTLERPFGRSRVSRAVMSITDRAIRAALRMDISSELYTAPGLILNGISEEAWSDIQGSWSWRLGSVKGLSPDEEGDKPEVKTLPQQSMQPYTDQLRELAAEFSGVTNLPLSSLGIVQDNPASAEAIAANKEELVIEATNANKINGYSLRRVYQNAVVLRDGLDAVTDELRGLATRWRNPSMPSIVSQSDAIVKQISAIPDLALTDVVFEELGYPEEKIRRIKAQIRQAKNRDALRGLLTADQTTAADAATGQAATAAGGA